MAALKLNWNRALSGWQAAFYVIGAFLDVGAEAGFKVIAVVTLPLACIWFSDAMGGYTGPTTGLWITAPSPGVFVCILGWMLLLLPLVFLIL